VDLSSLTVGQWALGAIGALIVGCSKTGVPGIGILAVPLMAAAFGGKPSVGALLPMLIVADCFAVAWYRRHAQWDKLWGVLLWVLPGVVIGTVALWGFDRLRIPAEDRDSWFKVLIGLVVLVMLVLMLLRRRYGERLTPQHRGAVIGTGVSAGIATTVANAAGPIMTIYLTGMRLPKQQFMGTNAWYFLLINVLKVPIYAALTLFDPDNPMFTATTLAFDALMLPLIFAGVFLGKWLLPRIPQRGFDALILILAAIAALNLLLDPVF